MRRYHINPKTGVPSICRAEQGKCPYGGKTGEQNHYDTYGEAQKKSQQYFEKLYNLLPNGIPNNSKEIMNEVESKLKVNKEMADKLKSGTPFEVTKEIIQTTDENLIVGVIQGEVSNGSRWTLTSAALQNPNIPKKMLNEIVFDYPDSFESTTRKWAILNSSIKHEELLKIIEDENEDPEVRALAFRNPNIDKEYVENIIKKDPKKLEQLPHSMILYSENKTSETDYMKSEALILRLRPYADISKAQDIALKFVPWHLAYKKDLEKES